MQAVRLIAAYMLLCCNAELIGHLKKFGSHRQGNVATIELTEVPQPQDFFERFVKPRIPVVFRGAALHSGATRRWGADNLAEEYGDMVVRLEAKAEASGEIPITDIGLGRSTLRYFTRNFHSMDAYVISQIPQEMERDVSIPPCLRCGNFARGLQEVHLFVVGKGGKTLIHRDPFSNIHCVFNGTKDWILVEDKYEKFLYQSPSSLDEFGGYSLVDVDHVDLKKFPDVQRVEYSMVTLNGGDCIFVPGGYWHQVRVNGEYNTAVSIWFTRNFKHSIQDWSDCTQQPYNFTPLSQVPILWRFSGGNTSLSQGHMDIYVMRQVLLSTADELGQVSFARFTRHFLNLKSADEANRVTKQILEILQRSDDVIDVDEIKSLSVDNLKRILTIFNPNDESNTAEYEYSIIDPGDVRDFLEGFEMTSSREDFVNEYKMQLKGSDAVGNQVYDLLDKNSRGFVTKTDVINNIERIAEKFENSPKHDPSTERMWLRHLRERDEL